MFFIMNLQNNFLPKLSNTFCGVKSGTYEHCGGVEVNVEENLNAQIE